MKEKAQNAIREHLSVIDKVFENLDDIIKSSEVIVKALKNEGTIYFCGNGGSAGDSQHLAAEFTGRFQKERKGLAAIALSTYTSVLTAIGNDYGYDRVFSRQIEALAKPNDVLVAISTSGDSKNVINAVNLAKKTGCQTIGLLGKTGGALKSICDIPIFVNSSNTARIQEAHIMIGHIICGIIDDHFD